MNFMATSLNPFCSNLEMIWPARPRCTASGFSMRKVLSQFAGFLQVRICPVLVLATSTGLAATCSGAFFTGSGNFSASFFGV